MTDAELMQAIKTQWGATIDSACAASSVPPAFIAALIAGESGGNANAKRFEKNVLASLWEVLLGRKAAYGSIGRADLVSFVTGIPGVPVRAPATLPADAFQRVDSLATSWGLTQIMGYEAIAFRLDGVAKLQEPASELAITLTMLVQFAGRNMLDLGTDFSELFDCWNTGRPHAPTADPQYVPNGLARMKLYEALA